MPMDLIARTPLQREHDIRYLASLPLNELRKRQDIVNEQYQITIRKEHTKNVLKSLDNLDEMLRDLLEAIDRREFSEGFPKPRKTKRARSGSIEDMKTILSGTNIKGVPMCPPRSLKLMNGNSIMLDGREYKQKFATCDLRDAVKFAEEISTTHDVYITYSGSLYHDDSSTIYVYAAPHKTKQTKLFRAIKKRPVKPAQKTGKKKRVVRRRK